MNYENPAKLERATKWAKANGKENDAEAIRAQYIALGGAISGLEEEIDTIKTPISTPKAVEGKPVEKIVRRRRGQK